MVIPVIIITSDALVYHQSGLVFTWPRKEKLTRGAGSKITGDSLLKDPGTLVKLPLCQSFNGNNKHFLSTR